MGDVEPLTSADVVGRSHLGAEGISSGHSAEYVAYTPRTAQNLKSSP
jgi:hypothetical protein